MLQHLFKRCHKFLTQITSSFMVSGSVLYYCRITGFTGVPTSSIATLSCVVADTSGNLQCSWTMSTGTCPINNIAAINCRKLISACNKLLEDMMANLIKIIINVLCHILPIV